MPGLMLPGRTIIFLARRPYFGLIRLDSTLERHQTDQGSEIALTSDTSWLAWQQPPDGEDGDGEPIEAAA